MRDVVGPWRVKNINIGCSRSLFIHPYNKHLVYIQEPNTIYITGSSVISKKLKELEDMWLQLGLIELKTSLSCFITKQAVTCSWFWGCTGILSALFNPYPNTKTTIHVNILTCKPLLNL